MMLPQERERGEREQAGEWAEVASGEIRVAGMGDARAGRVDQDEHRVPPAVFI